MPEAYVAPSVLAPTLDGAGLISEASKRKEKANEFFQMGLYDAAMQSYLTAIWYLKLRRPSYPEVLSGQVPPAGTEATRHLGDGPPAPQPPPKASDGTGLQPPEDWISRYGGYVMGVLGGAWCVGLAAAIIQLALAHDVAVEKVAVAFAIIVCLVLWLCYSMWHSSGTMSSTAEGEKQAEEGNGTAGAGGIAELEGEGASTLRMALHLNVAACALKRSDWYLAREAAQHVLRKEAHHPKALYRLAQAWDGAGEAKTAAHTLTTLLKLEGQSGNREARRLLADVQQRRESERALFRGVCGKSGFCQTDTEVAAIAERDAAEKRNRPKDALSQRFDAYAEYEKRRSLGFRWEQVDASQSPTGRELHHPALEQALRRQNEFTWVELDKLGVEDLQADHFILVDGKRFEPRGRDWDGGEPAAAAPTAVPTAKGTSDSMQQEQTE